MFRPFVYLIENKYFNSSYGILIVLCVCSLCYSCTNHSCLQSVYKTRWQNCIRLFKIMEHKVVFHSPLMGLKAGFSLTFHTVSKKNWSFGLNLPLLTRPYSQVTERGMFDSSNAGGLVHRGN